MLTPYGQRAFEFAREKTDHGIQAMALVVARQLRAAHHRQTDHPKTRCEFEQPVENR